MDAAVHILMRCDHHPIPQNKNEVRLFLLIRNELVRLPYFLEYYRKLGVKRFFVVDNGSLDASVEYLCAQPDCHVFLTTDNFLNYPNWINRLLHHYGVGHWCLTVDVDELFVYPESEQVAINTFCAFLDQEGVDAVPSFLLDLYSDQPLDKVIYESGQAFTEICPYFDKDYQFLVRASIINLFKSIPLREPFGGPRLRVFYRRWDKRNAFVPWAVRFTNILGSLLSQLGLVDLREAIQGPPILYKIPLIKWREDLVWSAHGRAALSMLRLSTVTTALLHFKFFADFYDKAILEAARGQHYGSAVEYQRYSRHHRNKSNTTFMYDGSVCYTGTSDLLQHDLIKTSPAYQDYVAKLKVKESDSMA